VRDAVAQKAAQRDLVALGDVLAYLFNRNVQQKGFPWEFVVRAVAFCAGIVSNP
jgi:hypothetical protein